MNYVVDTNVAIAANGENTHADIGCQYACVVFLQSLAKHGSRDAVAIDSLELILREYQLHLSYSGQPGVGDMFFKFRTYLKIA